ncbi:MAG TPA: DUF6159 family protein [Thermoplasmataceae archaeon]|nr:DUF6159 family protein [Thermoplasmataceae archaeon]
MAFTGLKAGWSLAKSVRALVSGDRSLLIYPVISGIIGVVLFGLTFLGSLFIPIDFPVHWKIIVGVAISYVVTGFVSTYFLVAMLISFKSYEAGDRIGMGEALARTRPYTVRILEWAIFYTILVMILRAIESRFRGISQIVVAGVGSLGITIATFFAVPAILEKKVGPIDAVKESLGTIRRTVGPVFGGVVYIDLYTLIFTLGGMLLALAGGIFMPNLVLKVILIGTGVAIMVLGMVLNFTYFNILKLLLYDYFNGEKLPEGIDETLVQQAIKRRGKLL